MQLQCPHSDCALVKDCVFLEIIQKIPVSSKACSYFRTEEQERKRVEKESKKNK